MTETDKPKKVPFKNNPMKMAFLIASLMGVGTAYTVDHVLDEQEAKFRREVELARTEAYKNSMQEKLKDTLGARNYGYLLTAGVTAVTALGTAFTTRPEGEEIPCPVWDAMQDAQENTNIKVAGYKYTDTTLTNNHHTPL